MSIPRSLVEALRWLSDAGGSVSGKDVPQQFNRPLYDCTLCNPPLVSLYMATFSITEWGRDALTESDAPAKTIEQPAETKPTAVTWQDAAERMERLREQGEPFTSQPDLAKRFVCSPSTINKAIKETPSLHAWAKSNAAIPKVLKNNAGAFGCTAQNRELNPADDAAIREYLEREDLTSDDRAFFNGMQREAQLLYLDQLADDTDEVRGPRP